MPIYPADKRDNRVRERPHRQKAPTYQRGTLRYTVEQELNGATEIDVYLATELTQRLAPRFEVEPATVRKTIRHVLESNKKALA